MKSLSHWASRHVWQARLIIILIGIFRGIVGVLFGFMFLKNMNATAMNLAACLLFSIIFGIETLFHRRKLSLLNAPDKLYAFRVRCLSILYTCNFLLFMLVSNAVYRLEPAADMSVHTTLRSIISYKNDPSVNVSKKEVFVKKHFLGFEKIKKKWQQRLTKDRNSFEITIFSILGILLILASIYLLAGFACGISCGGAESLVLLYLFSSIGTFVGGLFSLIYAARILNKQVAKRRSENPQNPIEHEKTPEQMAKEKSKKKLIRHILIGWGIVATAIILWLFAKRS